MHIKVCPGQSRLDRTLLVIDHSLDIFLQQVTASVEELVYATIVMQALYLSLAVEIWQSPIVEHDSKKMVDGPSQLVSIN